MDNLPFAPAAAKGGGRGKGKKGGAGCSFWPANPIHHPGELDGVIQGLRRWWLHLRHSAEVTLRGSRDSIWTKPGGQVLTLRITVPIREG